MTKNSSLFSHFVSSVTWGIWLEIPNNKFTWKCYEKRCCINHHQQKRKANKQNSVIHIQYTKRVHVLWEQFNCTNWAASKVYLIWFWNKRNKPQKNIQTNRERKFINCYYISLSTCKRNNNTKDWLGRLFSNKNNQSTCGYQIELNA